MRTSAAAVLREARERAGLSQTALGPSRRRAAERGERYERGQREPSYEAFLNLIEAAGFTAELALKPRDDHAKDFTGPVGRRLQRRRTAVRTLLDERGYANAAVFGSVARGEDGADSDVDLLVDLPDDVGLIELNRTAIDLEAVIGARVDLISRTGLRSRASARIDQDVVPL